MPTYTYRNKATDIEWTEMRSIAENDQFLQDNPHIIQLIVKAPTLGDSARLGFKKPDEGFRDILRAVKKRSPGSKINTF